jgi:hypothetical protein
MVGLLVLPAVSSCSSSSDDGGSSGGSCAELCDCVAGVLGEGSRTQCTSDCDGAAKSSNARSICEAKVDFVKANSCSGLCAGFPGEEYNCRMEGSDTCTCSPGPGDENACRAIVVEGACWTSANTGGDSCYCHRFGCNAAAAPCTCGYGFSDHPEASCTGATCCFNPSLGTCACSASATACESDEQEVDSCENAFDLLAETNPAGDAVVIACNDL